MQSSLRRSTLELLKFRPSFLRCFSGREAAWRPSLQAIARRKCRNGGAAFYRAHGLISAVICEGMRSEGGRQQQQSSSLLVFLKEKEVAEFLQKMGHQVFMSTVFVMHVSSSLKPEMETFIERVLPRTVNFDDSGKITNVRFLKAPAAGIKLKLNCPVVFARAKDCLGIKKGAVDETCGVKNKCMLLQPTIRRL